MQTLCCEASAALPPPPPPFHGGSVVNFGASISGPPGAFGRSSIALPSPDEARRSFAGVLPGLMPDFHQPHWPDPPPPDSSVSAPVPPPPPDDEDDYDDGEGDRDGVRPSADIFFAPPPPPPEDD